MGTPSKRYVCKAVAGKGWRIWNRKTKRWWGNHYKDFPTMLLEELNGQARSEQIDKLSRGSFR